VAVTLNARINRAMSHLLLRLEPLFKAIMQLLNNLNRLNRNRWAARVIEGLRTISLKEHQVKSLLVILNRKHLLQIPWLWLKIPFHPKIFQKNNKYNSQMCRWKHLANKVRMPHQTTKGRPPPRTVR
jgi:hypothetical protein